MYWVVGFARTDKFYPTPAVAAAGSAAAVPGVGYSVLMSMNGGASWSMPPVRRLHTHT